MKRARLPSGVYACACADVKNAKPIGSVYVAEGSFLNVGKPIKKTCYEEMILQYRPGGTIPCRNPLQNHEIAQVKIKQDSGKIWLMPGRGGPLRRQNL